MSGYRVTSGCDIIEITQTFVIVALTLSTLAPRLPRDYTKTVKYCKLPNLIIAQQGYVYMHCQVLSFIVLVARTVDTMNYSSPFTSAGESRWPMAPSYLCNGLQRVAELNRHRLCSSMSNAFVVPATRLVTVGDRAFPVAGSRLWNSLPTNVTSTITSPVFCSRLKT